MMTKTTTDFDQLEDEIRNDMDDLAPCPFCGASDIRFNSVPGTRYARCQKCSATGGYVFDFEGELYNRRTVIERWNTRNNIAVLDRLRDIAHATATQHGWWDDNRSTGEALLKVIVEVAEAVQSLEAGVPTDKHLPQFDSFTVELADIVIRVFDLAGELNRPLGAAIVAKMAFNESRPYRHGKQF
jgi:Lar family restriction alleviation protein